MAKWAIKLQRLHSRFPVEIANIAQLPRNHCSTPLPTNFAILAIRSRQHRISKQHFAENSSMERRSARASIKTYLPAQQQQQL
jgi:hypothetical protein